MEGWCEGCGGVVKDGGAGTWRDGVRDVEVLLSMKETCKNSLRDIKMLRMEKGLERMV